MLENKSENKVWKIASIVLNCIFYVFIGILLIFSISNLNVKKDAYNIPGLFGKGYLTVLTPSMDGDQEDSFTTEDLIFVKKVTDKNREKIVEELEVGDIITFVYYSSDLRKDILNTHRIVDIVIADSGEKIFVTQGDKVAMNPDTKYGTPGLSYEYYENVSENNIKAVYTGKWSGAGNVMSFLLTSNGFLLCIVLPTALFFIYEAILLVMNFMKLKSQKDQVQKDKEHEEDLARIKAELEAEREKIRSELLAEMQAEKEQKEEQE